VYHGNADGLKQFKNKLPKGFRFIADGFTAYPLAARQFFREFGEDMKFEVIQVIVLTNDDAVTKEFRPFKQIIERLNHTYKLSYRITNRFDSLDGANYDLSFWVAYYNFLRHHSLNHGRPLNQPAEIPENENIHACKMAADDLPGSAYNHESSKANRITELPVHRF
jgi:hypothetical protein